jgi:hypothetical protein
MPQFVSEHCLGVELPAVWGAEDETIGFGVQVDVGLDDFDGAIRASDELHIGCRSELRG